MGITGENRQRESEREREREREGRERERERGGRERGKRKCRGKENCRSVDIGTELLFSKIVKSLVICVNKWSG